MRAFLTSLCFSCSRRLCRSARSANASAIFIQGLPYCVLTVYQFVMFSVLRLMPTFKNQLKLPLSAMSVKCERRVDVWPDVENVVPLVLRLCHRDRPGWRPSAKCRVDESPVPLTERPGSGGIEID